jgi:flagellar hook-associated protein 3 FlgL
MRIADKMALQQVHNSLGKNRLEMHNLQEQSSTQRRINRPSDDPLGAAKVLGSRIEEKNNKQFIKSLESAKDFLNYTDQSLGEVSEILNRAKEIAINQASEGSSNDGTRQVAAREIEQLLMQTMQVANSKLGDRYIFAGYRTNQAPFNRIGDYAGDDGEIKIQVNSDGFVSMNVPGNKVFLGEFDQAGPLDTSLVPRSSDELNQLKQQDQLDREKKAEAMPLAQVYTRDASGRGLASVPSQSEEAEADVQSQERGTNIFQVMQGLVNSLRSNDTASIQGTLEQLDLAFNQVISARSQVGARVSTLTTTLDSLQKNVVDAKTRASRTEDADIYQLVNDMNRADTALKATLGTSGRLIQPSLLDFLK